MIQTGFLRKEFKELIKTPKMLILSILFIFFAIIGPLTAKYMNELISAFGGDIKIEFPEPSYIDAWIQFFKNTTSICYIVFLLLITGSVVSEKTKGSILLVLTKNVSRKNFVLSKSIAGITMLFFAYILSVFLCVIYIELLFPDQSGQNVWFAVLLLYALGVFFTAFGIFVSVISKSGTMAAILGFSGYIFFNLLTISPQLSKYVPTGISTLGVDIISGKTKIKEAILMLTITLVLSFVFTYLSVSIFKKQEL